MFMNGLDKSRSWNFNIADSFDREASWRT